VRFLLAVGTINCAYAPANLGNFGVFISQSHPSFLVEIMLLSAPECTMRASSEVRSDNPHGAAGKAA